MAVLGSRLEAPVELLCLVVPAVAFRVAVTLVPYTRLEGNAEAVGLAGAVEDIDATGAVIDTAEVVGVVETGEEEIPAPFIALRLDPAFDVVVYVM